MDELKYFIKSVDDLTGESHILAAFVFITDAVIYYNNARGIEGHCAITHSIHDKEGNKL